MFMDFEAPSNPPLLSSSSSKTRKKDRKWRRVPVELSSLLSSAGPEWNGTAVNLSRDGCAICSTTPVHTGDYLHMLIFPGANQTPIEVEMVQVRWSTNEEFGVEFITLAPREAARLQDFLTLLGV
jgi:hypothetical protein